MLLSTMSIRQVAEQTGFPDQMYFSRVFTNAEGITPSQYRQKHLDASFVSTSKKDGTIIKRRESIKNTMAFHIIIFRKDMPFRQIYLL